MHILKNCRIRASKTQKLKKHERKHVLKMGKIIQSTYVDCRIRLILKSKKYQYLTFNP